MQQKIIETKITQCIFDELSEEYKKLVDLAKKQVEKAYAPYSGFHVGAAIQLENGEIFAASNQENSAYPSGLCAERVAMFFANAQYPDTPVKTLAIAAFTNGNFMELPITPCGACRQVLLESESRFDKDIVTILYGTEQIYIIDNVKQMLPLCFEKSSLKIIVDKK
ncbi:MAG TPA: cytidine deaminase [Paludibacter sp.]|nr:cytidine deaminase [Paludibacter sp.]